jgi:hypothetical protein
MQQIDYEQLAGKMNTESGRVCAILGAAALDTLFAELLRSRFVCHAEKLLEKMGPLASFDAKIKLARALNLICADTEADLDQIRHIRNVCAHSCDLELDFITFEARCSNLRTAKAYLEGVESTKMVAGNLNTHRAVDAIIETFSSPRWRFQLTVDFLVQHLKDLNRNDVSGEPLLNQVRTLGGRMIGRCSAEVKVS